MLVLIPAMFSFFIGFLEKGDSQRPSSIECEEAGKETHLVMVIFLGSKIAAQPSCVCVCVCMFVRQLGP